MQGEVKPILTVYDSISRKLIIPVYQRNYDWKIEQCERLYDDLVALNREDRESHFFGALVADSRDAFRWVIIDGQQRITTTSLLLLALKHSLDCGVIQSNDSELSSNIQTLLLESEDKNSRAKFKLKPVKNDAAAYQKLFNDQAPIEDSNITRNYRYFCDRIAQGELSGDELWRAVNGLHAMILTLGKDDDPQRIFESLNSTGLALSEADKIRNLVLMGAAPERQEMLYENYWNEIEESVDYLTDWFIRHYLTTRTRKTPRQDAVYEAFRTYQKGKDVEQVLSDMHSLANHAHDLTHSTTGVPAADRRLRKFNILRRDVTLPFLISVLGEYRNGSITDAELTKIIKIVDSYVFRRFICGIQTNSMNKTFSTLFAEASRLRGDASLVDAVTYLLTRRSEGSTRFPTDAEFKHEFGTRNLYKITPQNRNYLYECLENLDSNDTRDIAGALEDKTISVEHIMPQTLTADWIAELGDGAEQIHDTWLNRIGNLTITGYNSLYSNRPYKEKRETENGFIDSPYSLNKVMKNSPAWGLQQLENRTQQLTDAALSYWPRPVTSFKPKVDPLPTEPLGEDTSFNGRSVVSFEYRGTRKTVDSWITATLEIVQMIYLEHKDAVRKYAAEARFWSIADSSPRYHAEIAPNLHVLVSGETDPRISMLRGLFDALGLDKNELVFTLRRAPSKKGSSTEISPFATFTMFEPQVEELTSEGTTEEDAAQVLADLSAAAVDLRQGESNPLNNLSVSQISDSDFIATASVNDLLWTLDKFQELDRLVPGMGMLAHLKDGTLLKILQTVRQMEEPQ